MAGFIGSYSHSMDAKGRLVIPQSFRDKLGEQFCIAPSYDFNSIAIYPTEMWEKRSASYEKLGNMDPSLNLYRENFYALSFSEQSCDAQGRLLLPASIRQKILGEERDVELTGANDHIRVVGSRASADSWGQFRRDLPDLLKRIAELEKQDSGKI